MDINDITKARTLTTGSECEVVDRIGVTQNLLQETEPYTLSKSITGDNVYEWNNKFIEKVIESFMSTIVQNFSKKERVLFDKYVNFLINGTTGTLDEDVMELDTYIGTIKGDYL